MTKTCSKCRESKPLEGFASNPSGIQGRDNYCKPCKADYNRAWALAHPERARASQRKSRLKRLYGISPEEFDALLASQEGLCAICKTDDPRGANGGSWQVDHDHDTGEIRGILCFGCNVGLGKFSDDPILLAQAIDYLLGIKVPTYIG
jgi:hypothetical protein